jgi:hypothetical protein
LLRPESQAGSLPKKLLDFLHHFHEPVNLGFGVVEIKAGKGGGFHAQPAGQARDNARWLEKELSKATGERLTVQPIVALPGWWVTLKANSDVKVLSGKQISGFIAKEPAQLSGKAIQQISYQLEQRCRDVEF